MTNADGDRQALTLAVILTNYNHGATLARALIAITKQERHPDQLIIVDDGSQDNSLEVIEPFLVDPRVILIRKDKNAGLADAVLTGLEALRSDFVYFAAADDYILPGFFQAAMEAVSRYPDCGMVYGRLVSIQGNVQTRMNLFPEDEMVHSCLLTPKDFFLRYFSRFGPFTNLSPATIHRWSALESINYKTLLKEFDFILDSFVVQILGGKYPSYFVDADCAVWNWANEGGAIRFFGSPGRVTNFVRVAMDHLRREPYQSALSIDHFGLYIYGLWFRAIDVGFPFDPEEFVGVKKGAAERARSLSGGTDQRSSLKSEQLGADHVAAPVHLPTVLSEAHRVLANGLLQIDPRARLTRRWMWRAMLGSAKGLLGVLFKTHRAIHSLTQVLRGVRAVIKSNQDGSDQVARSIYVPQGAPPVSVAIPLERKTLSALICNYNHGRYISSAIEAVIAQTRQPDELLILDDGSTDGSFETIERYAGKHSWIHAYRNEENQGYIAGISKLTALAKGDFIHRGTSDDYMLPGFVASTMDMAERFPEAGIVSGKLSVLNEKLNTRMTLGIPGITSGYVTPEKYLHEYLEATDPRASLAPSTIFRRMVIDELGGWRGELDIWDVSFFLQAAALKYGMAYVDAPLYTWVYRKASWTQTSNRNAVKSTEVCLRYFDLMHSPEFRPLFKDKFPLQWLRANLQNIADNVYEQAYERINLDAAP